MYTTLFFFFLFIIKLIFLFLNVLNYFYFLIYLEFLFVSFFIYITVNRRFLDSRIIRYIYILFIIGASETCIGLLLLVNRFRYKSLITFPSGSL